MQSLSSAVHLPPYADGCHHLGVQGVRCVLYVDLVRLGVQTQDLFFCSTGYLYVFPSAQKSSVHAQLWLGNHLRPCNRGNHKVTTFLSQIDDCSHFCALHRYGVVDDIAVTSLRVKPANISHLKVLLLFISPFFYFFYKQICCFTLIFHKSVDEQICRRSWTNRVLLTS